MPVAIICSYLVLWETATFGLRQISWRAPKVAHDAQVVDIIHR